MKLLDTQVKNNVLQSMMTIIDKRRNEIVEENKKDLESFNRNDQALYDRLVVDQKKVDGMIQSIKEVKEQDDPVGNTISERTLDSGLKIVNKTDPFGTIMIIYESRPDVTIEAAVLAFKANNKIFSEIYRQRQQDSDLNQTSNNLDVDISKFQDAFLKL